jgi:hypothetical protein
VLVVIASDREGVARNLSLCVNLIVLFSYNAATLGGVEPGTSPEKQGKRATVVEDARVY